MQGGGGGVGKIQRGRRKTAKSESEKRDKEVMENNGEERGRLATELGGKWARE